MAALPDMAGSRVHSGVDPLADHVLWKLGQTLMVPALGVVELLVSRLPGLAVALFAGEAVCDDLSGEGGSVWVGPYLRCVEAHLELISWRLMGARGCSVSVFED